MRHKSIPTNHTDTTSVALVRAAARLVAAYGGREGLHRLPALGVSIPLGFRPPQEPRPSPEGGSPPPAPLPAPFHQALHGLVATVPGLALPMDAPFPPGGGVGGFTLPAYPVSHQDGQPPAQSDPPTPAPPAPPAGNIVHLHLGSPLDEDTVRNHLIPLLDRLRATG